MIAYLLCTLILLMLALWQKDQDNALMWWMIPAAGIITLIYAHSYAPFTAMLDNNANVGGWSQGRIFNLIFWPALGFAALYFWLLRHAARWRALWIIGAIFGALLPAFFLSVTAHGSPMNPIQQQINHIEAQQFSQSNEEQLHAYETLLASIANPEAHLDDVLWVYFRLYGLYQLAIHEDPDNKALRDNLLAHNNACFTKLLKPTVYQQKTFQLDDAEHPDQLRLLVLVATIMNTFDAMAYAQHWHEYDDMMDLWQQVSEVATVHQHPQFYEAKVNVQMAYADYLEHHQQKEKAHTIRQQALELAYQSQKENEDHPFFPFEAVFQDYFQSRDHHTIPAPSDNSSSSSTEIHREQRAFDDAEKALLNKAQRLVASLPDRLKNRPQVAENHTPHKKIITVAEAKAMGAQTYQDDDSKVLLIEGDVHINGDLNQDWINAQLKGMQWQGDLYDVMIAGNLTVAGDILDDDEDTYLHLQVLGNVVCDVFYSENGHQYIKGDLTAFYGIHGEYNDGSLHIDGKLDTPFIIANDHDMPRDAKGDFIYIEYGKIGREYTGESGWGWEYFDHSAALFNPLVLDKRHNLVEEKFLQMLKNGDNPFVDIKP